MISHFSPHWQQTEIVSDWSESAGTTTNKNLISAASHFFPLNDNRIFPYPLARSTCPLSSNSSSSISCCRAVCAKSYLERRKEWISVRFILSDANGLRCGDVDLKDRVQFVFVLGRRSQYYNASDKYKKKRYNEVPCRVLSQLSSYFGQCIWLPQWLWSKDRKKCLWYLEWGVQWANAETCEESRLTYSLSTGICPHSYWVWVIVQYIHKRT